MGDRRVRAQTPRLKSDADCDRNYFNADRNCHRNAGADHRGADPNRYRDCNLDNDSDVNQDSDGNSDPSRDCPRRINHYHYY